MIPSYLSHVERIELRYDDPARRGEKRAFLLNQNSFFKTARGSGHVSVTYSNISGKTGW
jgi:hypothetical protein